MNSQDLQDQHESERFIAQAVAAEAGNTKWEARYLGEQRLLDLVATTRSDARAKLPSSSR